MSQNSENTHCCSCASNSNLAKFSEEAKAKEKKKARIDLFKLILAIVLTVAVLIFRNFAVSGMLSNYIMLALTIPVQFYCGWGFIKGAWKSIQKKSPNMDLLVSLGTLITFIYSLYIIFFGGKPYFETSCMLITFISFGEYIENRAKNQSNKAVDGLLNLVPKKLHKIIQIENDEALISVFAKGQNFKIEESNSSDVSVGDYIFIAQGESIPADSVVILGEAEVDESMLTGESNLIYKGYNDEITGGTLLASGQLIAKVVHTNENSVLSKIVKAVLDAQNSKAPVARVADKVAGIFVPVILILSVLVFVFWMIFYSGFMVEKINWALMCAVSVLTITCPCALVLATPISLTVGMGKAAQLGIIIRDASVLENMCKVKNVVFDKTGTLTQSNLDKNMQAAKTLRSDSKETVTRLQKDLSINTYMISGDKKDEAIRIANQIGIDTNNVVYEASPTSKKDHLQALMDDGKKLDSDQLFAYVGDGINDAPAMKTADVGITLESATDIALESGDVVLMHNKLIDLITAIRLSKASMRKIKQNLFWALCYNVIFIPLAAAGIMLPMWCGAVHALSSLIVVFNALLLKRFK